MSSGPNQILTSANAQLQVTNLTSIGSQATATFSGIPLGTSDGTATGALAVKIVGAGSGGGLPGQTVTLHTALLGASATQAIPTGAKGYLVSIITGTATVNGTPAVPAGVFLSDSNTLLAGFSVVTDSASSAFVAWNT